MTTEGVLDIVAVGLGPANLGLAAAVDELDGDGAEIGAVFLDRRPAFDWHPDMLLPSSVMQISFLKDLATQRDPTSRFTFINYLHDRGRLNDFINMQTFSPTRAEFTDYLEWVVDRLTVDVRWRRSVTRMDLDAEGLCRVQGTHDGEAFELVSRNVVLGVGSRPVLPTWAERLDDERVIHNTALRSGLGRLGLREGARVAVLGHGQSAAEVIRYALETLPGAEVHNFISGYGMVPADNSPYANRVFDPTAVDDFFFASSEVRNELLQRHRSTNYGCVDSALLQWLYESEYADKVAGRRRLHVRQATVVVDARSEVDGMSLDVADRLAGEHGQEHFDAVVCATGFRSDIPAGLLGSGLHGADCEGISRDYRLMVDRVPQPVFVVGASRSNHGLGAGLLSNIAVRSGELLATMGLAVPEQALGAAQVPSR